MTKNSYPATKSIPTSENLHGHVLHNNYRWLEDTESQEIGDWIDK